MWSGFECGIWKQQKNVVHTPPSPFRNTETSTHSEDRVVHGIVCEFKPVPDGTSNRNLFKLSNLPMKAQCQKISMLYTLGIHTSFNRNVCIPFCSKWITGSNIKSRAVFHRNSVKVIIITLQNIRNQLCVLLLFHQFLVNRGWRALVSCTIWCQRFIKSPSLCVENVSLVSEIAICNRQSSSGASPCYFLPLHCPPPASVCP